MVWLRGLFLLFVTFVVCWVFLPITIGVILEIKRLVKEKHGR